jgi:hypothetical protein
MSAPDIFALGGRDETQGAEILALFRQWIEAERAADKYSRDNPDDKDGFNKRSNAAWSMVRQMAATPAVNVTGVAVKAYMLAWCESGGSYDDPPRYPRCALTSTSARKC